MLPIYVVCSAVLYAMIARRLGVPLSGIGPCLVAAAGCMVAVLVAPTLVPHVWTSQIATMLCFIWINVAMAATGFWSIRAQTAQRVCEKGCG